MEGLVKVAETELIREREFQEMLKEAGIKTAQRTCLSQINKYLRADLRSSVENVMVALPPTREEPLLTGERHGRALRPRLWQK